jgi:hypothetical protein
VANYVVKFLDNPQHPRVLANEWLGTQLAARLGLPTPQPAVVEVPEDLVERSDDLVIDLGRSRKKVRGGLQFGSGYPGDPADTAVYDFLIFLFLIFLHSEQAVPGPLDPMLDGLISLL